MTVDAIGLKI